MTAVIDTGDPVAVAAVRAIRQGDVPRLQRLLADQPQLATAALGDARKARSLLHVATDWPGHYPSCPTAAPQYGHRARSSVEVAVGRRKLARLACHEPPSATAGVNFRAA